MGFVVYSFSVAVGSSMGQVLSEQASTLAPFFGAQRRPWLFRNMAAGQQGTVFVDMEHVEEVLEHVFSQVGTGLPAQEQSRLAALRGQISGEIWRYATDAVEVANVALGLTSSSAASAALEGSGANMEQAQCGHLRSIAGAVGAEYQGHDWVCGFCWHEVLGTGERPPRMWPKVPVCRRCKKLRAEVEASHGVTLVRDLPEGTLFAS